MIAATEWVARAAALDGHSIAASRGEGRTAAMSEYQSYEFQAVDRPLTEAEMADLRALSSRAKITPSRFVNVYNFGDFRGDPLQLMQRYFDAFVYEANWGKRQLMFRLPSSLVPSDTLAP